MPILEAYLEPFWPATLLKRETPTHVFSCEYCEFFENSYFEEHMRTASSIKILLPFLIYFIESIKSNIVVKNRVSYSEAYSGLCETSVMELFC